ncbi:50S ribosomal protein L31 [Pseudidiomarina tainanensis]|jgi:large subunit ribosomal protein L31|uniref:Large ribosomal subunit protein bL31 n=2 Tax=Pseudidiomarina TaxID=2800384 RepID=A0A1I6H999_9GAMM|nr:MULTISPECIES: 50S ribosomal protein L31 [Pseudidiomarina]RZQ55648.1 50S ribosomal protein L31 [Pseudidiomarina tainanensis]SFR51065.1 LSU ribosomal protein L31P [Pseudidiomarina maritima]
MKQGIHPEYSELKVSCSCGHSFVTHSTKGGELHLDVCSECHPFYTGKQRIMDTGGRIEKFNKRFNMLGGKK